MIVKQFDNGWGRQYPLKQYEQLITDQLIRPFFHSQKKVVVINSVWYTDQFHVEVCQWLANNDFDHIVLIAMLDAAIPSPDWYNQFGRPVTGIGYYQGPGAVDFCALFVSKFLDIGKYHNLSQATLVDRSFMCLMRKPHWHRKLLWKKLTKANVINSGLVSMGSDSGNAFSNLPVDTGPDDLAPNADISHYGVPNDIVSLGHSNNWHRHFLNVVAETFYDINQVNFVSEKIYKPIVGQRPFLVFDPDGATQWLTDRKFEPYVKDFADISDLDLANPNNLVPFLTVLSQQGVEYWQAKLLALMPKIQYNSQRFCEYVAEQNFIVEQGVLCQI